MRWRRAGGGNHAVCLQLSLSGEHKNSWVLCALRGVARPSCRNLASCARQPGSLSGAELPPSAGHGRGTGSALGPSHQQHLAVMVSVEVERTYIFIVHNVQCVCIGSSSEGKAASLLKAWSAFTFKEWVLCWDTKISVHFNLSLVHFNLMCIVHEYWHWALTRVILCEWCCKFILDGWL